MIRIAIGIVIGMTLAAAAQVIDLSKPINQGYLICVPPWDATDAQGVIHHYNGP
jgi:xanthine/uracil permease